MIDRKDLTILVLVSFMLAVTLYPKITASQSSVASADEYDPWIDYNDDGKIDHKDLLQLAATYGSSGNPTKAVEVTNWPVHNDITVWWYEPVSPKVLSPFYNASGFGQLHILVYALGLDENETLRVIVFGELWNEAHTVEETVVAYYHDLTHTFYMHAITIPIPSETFRFWVRLMEETGFCYVSLSFYLTWA